MVRLQLINNRLGSLIIDKNEPIDIQNLTINVKRSEKRHGTVYTVLLNVEFIAESREYLKACFETDGGIDAIVVANLYELDANGKTWNLIIDGSVNFESFDVGEITLIVNINQANFQQLIDSFADVEVDLETLISQNGITLPQQNVQVIQMHSKTILRTNNNTPDTYLPFVQGSVFQFTIPNGLS